MCPAKMIQIILMFIGAIIGATAVVVAPVVLAADFVSVVVGEGMYAGNIALNSVYLSLWGAPPGIVESTILPGTAIQLWEGLDYAAAADLPLPVRKREELESRREFGTIQENLDHFFGSEVINTFADGRTIYVGRGTKDGWGSFGLLEGFHAFKLRTDTRGSSVHDQTDVKAGCK
jgi:hypothetical protein